MTETRREAIKKGVLVVSILTLPVAPAAARSGSEEDCLVDPNLPDCPPGTVAPGNSASPGQGFWQRTFPGQP
jgi:hypothetical protein